jgi:hypothetical protein
MKLPNFHANQSSALHPLSGGRKNKFMPAASAIALALLLPGIASAALVINVQYGPNRNENNVSAAASMTGLYAGPSSDTGKTWNSFLGTVGNGNAFNGAQATNAALVDSTNHATSVILNFLAPEGYAQPGSALPIFRSAVFNNTANPINFVLSGLSPNKLYDFYAISGGSPSATYAGTFHVTGAAVSTSQSSTNTGPFTAFNSGNTLVFSGVAPTAGGLLTLTLEAGSYRTSNGFQLVELTAIPEPGSLLALGCLVGSGAFLRSRRRTK